MTTGSDKCSISSIIPMSCRNKAEAFARRLHSRLSSLGSQEDGRHSVDESSWLAARDNSVALSQPRHSDPDLYFDFTLVDSPGSPEEEVPQIELARLINETDNLNLAHGEDCHCSKQPPNTTTTTTTTVLSLNNSNGQTVSPGSDSSDGQYFDPESDDKVVNGGGDDVDGGGKCNDSLSIDSLSITSESPTLSLQDCPSVEYGSCLQDSLEARNDEDRSAVLTFLTPQDSNDSETDCTATNSLAKINGDVCDVECDIRLGNGHEEITSTDGTTSSNNLQNGFEHLEESPLDHDRNGEEHESYRSTLRIEHNLTVDINQKQPGEENGNNDIINEVELEIDDVEDREEAIPRVRRCSSLKTGKTPPGTPGRKKIVRFADVLGLDLADVRTFLDEIPKIPNSAYADLNADPACFTENSPYGPEYKSTGALADKLLVPLFQQPGGETNFLDRVRENQVCLENAVVDDPVTLSIKGTVRVRNLDFNKSVHVRYSLDSWKSFSDLQAAYVNNSCDGFSDKFTFLMYVNTIAVGQRVEFAVRFQCKGVQYWDNNNGVNYCFQCLPVTNPAPYSPITGAEESWGAAFY